MKIIAIDNAYGASGATEPSLVVYPDSCLLRNNDPFFIPVPAQKTIVRAGCFIRIEKIGKCIALQFASRYYTHVGIAFDFIQTDFHNQLQAKGLSTSPAHGFDKSFAVSNTLIDKEVFAGASANYKVKVNDTELTLTQRSSRFSLDEAIVAASEHFTLKIGDLLFVPAVSFDRGVKIGDILDGVFINELLLRCSMK